jgi:signal transduction histidine kinase
VEQGSGIVRSILGLSRVKEKDLARADLNRIVEEAVKLISDRFVSEVSVRFHPAPSLPPVLVAKELIQQMLLNLILNAADAMEHCGEIRLSTGFLEYLPDELALSPTPSASYVYVSVQDDGCGIEPEILPRVFEPFFTTKALSARRGTGLGLSMVYELARQMGYGLEVRSTVNNGSTFTILLPLADLNPA